MKINYFIIILNIFCLMPQFTLFCGKDIFQGNGTAITKILTLKNCQTTIYQQSSINLAESFISDLEGIEELDFDGKTLLNLENNIIGDIMPLLSIASTTLETIILCKNKIKHVDESTLCILRENFPALKRINLRENPLDNKKDIRRWQRNLQLPFKIKLKKRLTTTTETDD